MKIKNYSEVIIKDLSLSEALNHRDLMEDFFADCKALGGDVPTKEWIRHEALCVHIRRLQKEAQ